MAHGTHDFADDARNDGILVWVNGELVPRERAVVSVFDSGFVLGDGVWEKLGVRAGHPAVIERHLDRLFAGATAIMLFVAEPMFGELDVDAFFMEFDDERSGTFEPLRFVPKGTFVVLGLVTSKRGELESKDELKRRIEEASRYIDVDQLCLSPQCGFSSTVDGNALTRDEQVAKLRLVVETAEDVWGAASR
jgi:hypothetical protein